MRSMNTAGHILCSLVFAIALPSCAGQTSEPGASSEPTAGAQELLHEVQLDHDRRIEFYRLRDGSLAIREVKGVDDGPFLLDGMDKSARTLTNVFHHVQPNIEIPEKIVDAERRWTAQGREAAARPRRAYDRPPPPPAESTGGPGLDPTIASGELSAMACSADQFNDGFGGQWFLNNYCASGSWFFQDCEKNWGWTDNWTRHDSITSGPWWNRGTTVANIYVKQMEGDFTDYGSMDLYRWKCDGDCFWEWVIANKVLGPRSVVQWYFSAAWGDYFIDDTNFTRWKLRSFCGHLHFSVTTDLNFGG